MGFSRPSFQSQPLGQLGRVWTARALQGQLPPAALCCASILFYVSHDIKEIGKHWMCIPAALSFSLAVVLLTKEDICLQPPQQGPLLKCPPQTILLALLGNVKELYFFFP